MTGGTEYRPALEARGFGSAGRLAAGALAIFFGAMAPLAVLPDIVIPYSIRWENGCSEVLF